MKRKYWVKACQSLLIQRSTKKQTFFSDQYHSTPFSPIALCPTSLRSAPLPPMEAKSRSMPFLAQSWSCCFCKLLGKSYVVSKKYVPEFSPCSSGSSCLPFRSCNKFQRIFGRNSFLIDMFPSLIPVLGHDFFNIL